MFLLFLLFGIGVAYREETFEVEFVPTEMRVADACTLYASNQNGLNITSIRFHNDGRRYNTNTYSEILAINQDCTLVVFGFPDESSTDISHAEGTGVVRLWKTHDNAVLTVRPMKTDISWLNSDWATQQEAIKVYRFGFSVDIQGDTWIAGAPGHLNNEEGRSESQGRPDSLGYAFVFQDEHLHSCRSLFETGCVPFGADCLVGYGNWKNYYGFHKQLDYNLNDNDVNEFQKKCIPEQLPYYRGGYYGGGPLNPVLVPYFKWQQFGYDVAITGAFNKTSTNLYGSIFVSAPGDTNRFMENNPHEDGRNYGRVYAWDLSADTPRNKIVNTISTNTTTTTETTVYWWSPSLLSPYGPPNLRTSTYRAYGRAIAASKKVLAVSTYPLYENTQEPFVIVYDCNPKQSNCQESTDRGISINDIPGNALKYLTPTDLSYSDYAKPGPRNYIYAPSFQNNMIGDDIGVTGSNIIVPNRHNRVYSESAPKAHRFGKDSLLRETHSYKNRAQYGTDTQHLILENGNQITHLWPCDLGFTGYKPLPGTIENCEPCEVAYFSDDGWLVECDLCPNNRTTYEIAQHECKAVVPLIWPGMSWVSTREIMIIISLSVVGTWLLLVSWQYMCTNGRKKRFK